MSKFNAWMVPPLVQLLFLNRRVQEGEGGFIVPTRARGGEAYFCYSFKIKRFLSQESWELHSLTSYCDRDLTPGLTGLEELLKTDRTTGKTGTTLDHIIDKRKEK